MFYDNPNVEKLSEKVFIYRNFIDKETCDKIHNFILQEDKKEFLSPSNHLIDWYSDKMLSPKSLDLYNVWCKINELLMPEYCIHPQLMILATKEGDEMFVHADSPGENMEEGLTAEDTWNTCCVLHYGALVYFGEWEGGEVFYPHVRNDGTWVGNHVPFNEGNELKIKPNPGDLIIHGAHNDYAHGVHKIISGKRYAYSNFVLPVSKNPGTFPLYGTKENEDRLKNGTWLTPIGFKWEAPEFLKNKLESENVKSLPPNTFSDSMYPSEIKNSLKNE